MCSGRHLKTSSKSTKLYLTVINNMAHQLHAVQTDTISVSEPIYVNKQLSDTTCLEPEVTLHVDYFCTMIHMHPSADEHRMEINQKQFHAAWCVQETTHAGSQGKPNSSGCFCVHTHMTLQRVQTITFLSPAHSGWDQQCLVPIHDTMTPCQPSNHVTLTQQAYCHRTKHGVSLSERLKFKEWGDDVTVATGGWLGELGVGCLEGLTHTLGLLFSVHSQWAPSVEQSSL